MLQFLLPQAFVDRGHPQAAADDLPVEDQQQEAMEIDTPNVEYGRGHRAHRPVQRYKDFTATSAIPFEIPSTLPEEKTEPVPLQAHPSPQISNADAEKEVSPSEVLRRTVLDDRSWKRTPANEFGLYKKYWTLERRPHDPDSYMTREDMQEEEEEAEEAAEEAVAEEVEEGQAPEGRRRRGESAGRGEPGEREEREVQGHETPGNAKKGDVPKVKNFSPFPNWSSFRIGEWYWDDSQEKGRESFRKLIDIITSDNFSKEEIKAANWDQINRSLAASEFDDGVHGIDWADDGTSWQTAVVQVEVPFNRTSLRPGVHKYKVPGFRYRPLVPVITERLKDAARGDYFHIVPSELRWRPRGDSGPDVQVYGELYNSPAFLDAYRQVQVSCLRVLLVQ